MSIILVTLTLSVFLVSFHQIEVNAETKTIVVPDDFSKFSDAVGNATEGDTIFVKKGTYEIESPDINKTILLFGLEINKTLSIIGEDPENTTIVFPQDTRYGFPLLFTRKLGFNVTANNFEISNLTITNCDYGVFLRGNSVQVSNIITSSIVIYGNYCNIIGNNLFGPSWFPVYISGSFNNYIQNKGLGVQCDGSYNYWDSYSGSDSNGDGIGDTPYILRDNSQDSHPLMGPISSFVAGNWEETSFNVDVVSNSTISHFKFYPVLSRIFLIAQGEDGTTGFCRVTIPKELLIAQGNWTVLINEISTTPTVNEDANNTYLHFTYQHSTKTVEIIGTYAIPEFPSWIIIPFVVVGTIIIIKPRKKLSTIK